MQRIVNPEEKKKNNPDKYKQDRGIKLFYSKTGEISNIHEKTSGNNRLLSSFCFPDFYS